ncbi:SPOR domain-containing protein [Novosphingobium sp.]|uniref:SPOR domain-containing protein n=1 Tax=Novosphingobium sp. TaxID=1874826 RepID=UPI0025F85AE7|nr:SPOR domain-containing protein [Novosphingobium sp.]
MTGEHDEQNPGENPETWTDAEGEPLETERLALDEDDTRLPWLESGDDEYEDEGAGSGRVAGLAALSGVALLAIVGGIWWASHRGGDSAAVADGSVIAAPKEPYKEAPKNPGGKTFDGTGDTSFAVSEGQSRPAKMGENPGAVPPAPAAAASPSASVAQSGPATAGSGGVGVQVGAYSSKAAAEAGWTKLTGQAGSVLSGISHRVVEGTADIGKVYRLQAVAADAGAANALCGKLKSAGISCQVK